ncbi:hypothetical protein ACFVAJ_17080 [Agromyces sp. NPDC057679]|uniref:hypothetical protein n=1 Tax=Agromyces sp. NPDC057679 TaxID=3346207 RepID=UPI00366CB4AE
MNLLTKAGGIPMSSNTNPTTQVSEQAATAGAEPQNMTPLEIAQDLGDSIRWESDDTARISAAELDELLVAAIERDRAQRPTVLTEEEWMQTPEYIEAADWSGPSWQRRPVIVEWSDPTETPTQAVIRLNNEVLEYAEKMAGWQRRATAAEELVTQVRTVLA